MEHATVSFESKITGLISYNFLFGFFYNNYLIKAFFLHLADYNAD